MAHVTVTINGRQFRLACEPGDEAHLTGLAATLDRRITELRSSYGDIGDARLTIMAALMIANEVHETDAKLRKLEGELASLMDMGNAFAESARATQEATSAALNAAAERIEMMTRRINRSIGDNSVGMG